ncbi:unnamed protein product [Didymodactylos carnosus]|uniref:Uncharacterized protein n=1 Tax=Didymodactylos carnosus TaxID=1234261 RepID=A0A8S2GCC2_9BILA|nr:unnamed protein product [Didymodactylos carnosus]CAF4498248.1 unnamed protein product [Didymodactylos carnosus]
MAANRLPCGELPCPRCGKCRSFEHFAAAIYVIRTRLPGLNVRDILTSFAADSPIAPFRGPLAAFRAVALAAITAAGGGAAGALIAGFLEAIDRAGGIDDALAAIHPPGFCGCNA